MIEMNDITLQHRLPSLISLVKPERKDEVADLHHNESHSYDPHGLQVVRHEIFELL